MIRLAIRGYVSGEVLFEERLTLLGDRPNLEGVIAEAAKQHVDGPKLHMVEMEFLEGRITPDEERRLLQVLAEIAFRPWYDGHPADAPVGGSSCRVSQFARFAGDLYGRAEELRTLRPELHRLHRRGLDARLSGMQTSQDQSPRDLASMLGQPLTHRQVQIADLIAHGVTNKNIAYELHLRRRHDQSIYVDHTGQNRPREPYHLGRLVGPLEAMTTVICASCGVYPEMRQTQKGGAPCGAPRVGEKNGGEFTSLCAVPWLEYRQIRWCR